MAESKSKKSEKVKKYIPTEEASSRPRRLWTEKGWVAIGGSIEIRRPGQEPEQIKEATPAQYKAMASRLPALIKEVTTTEEQ